MPKNQTLKFKNKFNRGMTYIELIVVLSIFTIMSGITLTTYKDFQEFVNLKSFANEMALKFSEAQKNAVNGRLIDGAINSPNSWTPAYGLKFDIANINTAFVYFANLNSNFPAQQPLLSFACNTNACNPVSNGPYHKDNINEEALEKLSLSKGFYISKMEIYGNTIGVCPAGQATNVQNLEFFFIRPSPQPYFFVSNLIGCNFSEVKYADITISSSLGKQTVLRIHKTGQIQLL